MTWNIFMFVNKLLFWRRLKIRIFIDVTAPDISIGASVVKSNIPSFRRSWLNLEKKKRETFV